MKHSDTCRECYQGILCAETRLSLAKRFADETLDFIQKGDAYIVRSYAAAAFHYSRIYAEAIA